MHLFDPSSDLQFFGVLTHTHTSFSECVRVCGTSAVIGRSGSCYQVHYFCLMSRKTDRNVDICAPYGSVRIKILSQSIKSANMSMWSNLSHLFSCKEEQYTEMTCQRFGPPMFLLSKNSNAVTLCCMLWHSAAACVSVLRKSPRHTSRCRSGTHVYLFPRHVQATRFVNLLCFCCEDIIPHNGFLLTRTCN